MPKENDWFVRERSEALASLLLTSRSDVVVRNERERDDGADLIVELKEEGQLLSTKLFVVQVRGTVSDKKQWMKSIKPLFKAGPYYLPTCVFVIDVRDNKAEYAWLAEPKVADRTASLTFVDLGEFHPLDEQAVDLIVHRVQQWYDVLPRPALSQAN